MGIFATRPEEPFEWAGIPSEPERAQSGAERLATPVVDASGLDPAASAAVESIVIPVVPQIEIVTSGESGKAED